MHKPELLLAAAQNLSLLLRHKYGAGTPRHRTDRVRPTQQAATGLLGTLYVLLSTLWANLSRPWRPGLTWDAGHPLACAA